MIAAGALIVMETLTSPRSMPRNSVCHVVDGVDRHALAAHLAERARASESWPMSEGMSNACSAGPGRA
jgi:hypothetical protein